MIGTPDGAVAEVGDVASEPDEGAPEIVADVF